MPTIRTFLAEVTSVTDVHPHLRSITFGGAGLTDFEPLGPDTFLYVLLPPPGRTELSVDTSFSWAAYQDLPVADRPAGAYYTLRRWHPDRHEIEMLFVLHGDEGQASAWAGRAAIGDPVALWGPRTAFEPPGDTTAYLLVADETGLPAVAAILDHLPPDVPVRVVAEVADGGARHALADRPSVTVTWCHRDGLEAGTSPQLVEAVRALPDPTPTTYVWGGGESRAMTAVRRHVRQAIGLPRTHVSLVGYWRHADHAADPDDDGS